MPSIFGCLRVELKYSTLQLLSLWVLDINKAGHLYLNKLLSTFLSSWFLSLHMLLHIVFQKGMHLLWCSMEMRVYRSFDVPWCALTHEISGLIVQIHPGDYILRVWRAVKGRTDNTWIVHILFLPRKRGGIFRIPRYGAKSDRLGRLHHASPFYFFVFRFERTHRSISLYEMRVPSR